MVSWHGAEIHFWLIMKASVCLATAFAIREASACTVPFLSRVSERDAHGK